MSPLAHLDAGQREVVEMLEAWGIEVQPNSEDAADLERIMAITWVPGERRRIVRTGIWLPSSLQSPSRFAWAIVEQVLAAAHQAMPWIPPVTNDT